MNWVLLFAQPAVSRDWNGKRFAQQVFRLFDGPPAREAIMKKAAGDPGAIRMANGAGVDLPINLTDSWDGLNIDKVSVVANGVYTDVVVEYSNELQRIQYGGTFQSDTLSVPVGVIRYVATPGAASATSTPVYEVSEFQTKMTNGRHRVSVFFNTYTNGQKTLAEVLGPIRLEAGRLHILRGTKAMPDRFSLAAGQTGQDGVSFPLNVVDFWRFEGADYEVLGQFSVSNGTEANPDPHPQTHFWLRLAYSWICEAGIYANANGQAWPGLKPENGFAPPPVVGSRLSGYVPGHEGAEATGSWAVPPYERWIPKKPAPSDPQARTSIENIPKPTFDTYLQYPKVNPTGVSLLPGLA